MISITLAFETLALPHNVLLPVHDSITPNPTTQHITVITPDSLLSLIHHQKGDTVLLHFWATWCKPCLIEMPYLLEALSQTGVKHLLVCLDDAEDIQMVEQFVRERFPTLKGYLPDITDFDYVIPLIDPQWQGDIPFTVFWVNQQSHSHLGMFKSADDIIDFIRSNTF
jgi:thiol-disulfide isomerase/thioredoxin